MFFTSRIAFIREGIGKMSFLGIHRLAKAAPLHESKFLQDRPRASHAEGTADELEAQ